MNNILIVMIVGVYTSIIGQVSLSLGLTTTYYKAPEGVTEITDTGFLDGLLSMARWAINNVGSFIQLMTFNTSMPDTINAMIALPVGLGMFYLIYIMVRGGAN